MRPERDDEQLLRSIRSLGPDRAGGAVATDPVLAEEADLAHLGAIVRSLSDDDVTRDVPPAGVWAGIFQRVWVPGAGAAPFAESGGPAAAPAPEAPPPPPAVAPDVAVFPP